MIEDKDVSDILSESKVPLERLRQLARMRGMVLSAEDSRAEVIARIARLPFGLRQVKELLEVVSTPERRDGQTVSKVVTRCGSADVRKVLDALISERQESQQEKYSPPTQVGKNTLRIAVSYPEVDVGKSRLAQRIMRDVWIEIDHTPSGLTIRCSDQGRARQIVTGFIDRLNKVAPCEEITIDLSEVENAKTRTEFILKVMGGVNGFLRDNVRRLRASRLPSAARKDSEDEDEERTTVEREDFEASVRKVILTGERIDKSPYYRQLEGSGFFLSEASWIARNDRKGILAEFEIGFGDDENAKRFYYCVPRVFEMTSRGVYLKNGKKPTGDRLKELTQLLETAVLTACEYVRAKTAKIRVGKRTTGKTTTKRVSKTTASGRKSPKRR